MAISYKIEERHVIPNWRDFPRTVKLGELSVPRQQKDLFASPSEALLHDWREKPSLGVAADLINHSFISQNYDFPELKEATNYIIANAADSSKILLELSYNINNGINNTTDDYRNIIELGITSISEFEQVYEHHTIHKQLNRLKRLASEQPYNPIIWVELSRLYSFFGNKTKSERNMQIALQLSPNNRYILRSATRLFIHFEEHEKALFYLRKAEGVQNDPWLTSTHIAASSLMGRFSKLTKPAQLLINSGNFNNYELSELRSSLLTLEFREGSLKQAKKYFADVLKTPNDNSLAQLEWISYQDKIFDFHASQHFNKVINPFEALAFDSYQENNWKSTIDNCIYWFLDMPYSKRPIMLGSYVACMILQDYPLAIILCKAGLKANPNDPTLLNNLVYSMVMSDDVANAGDYIRQLSVVSLNEMSENEIIAIQATFGLIAFRSKNTDHGQKFYEQAIDNARRRKLKELEDLALLIYFGELIKSGLVEKAKTLYPFVSEVNPKHSFVLKRWKEGVVSLYNQTQSLS